MKTQVSSKKEDQYTVFPRTELQQYIVNSKGD